MPLVINLTRETARAGPHGAVGSYDRMVAADAALKRVEVGEMAPSSRGWTGASSVATRPRSKGLALLALASGAFVIGSSQGGAGGVLVEQARDLDSSIAVVGYSMSAYALGVVIATPLLTVLLARWDRRRILVTMMAVAVVVNVATALAPNVGSLVGVRFMAAIPHGVFLGAGSVVGAHVLGAKRRGRAMAIMMAGFTVSAILAVPLMKFVSAEYGWRLSYAGVAVASTISLALVSAFVPSTPAPSATAWHRDVTHLRGPAFWTTIAFCALGFAGFGAFFAYVVPVLEDVGGLSVGHVATVLALCGIAQTMGTLAAGRVTDDSPVRAARIGAIACLVGFIVLATAGTTAAVVIAMLLVINVAAAFMSQGAQTHFMDVIHASPMLGAAMSHASLNVANALGAAVGAMVIGAGLGYLAIAWFAVGFTVIGIGILVFGPGFRGAHKA